MTASAAISAPALLAEEHEAARRRQRAAPRIGGTRLRQFPGDLAGANVDRLQNALRLRLGRSPLRSAQILAPGLPRTGIGFAIHAALLERLEVVQSSRRIERRREPVRSAVLRRTNQRPGRTSAPGSAFANRPAVLADARSPRQLLHERACASSSLPSVRSRDVEEPVAIGLQQQLARPSLPLRIHQHRRLRGVPVPQIVRRELVVPLQLAGLGIQRQDAVGIQIVARAIVAVNIPSPGCRSASTACRCPDRKTPVNQVGAPPCSMPLPFHVSDPGSPGRAPSRSATLLCRWQDRKPPRNPRARVRRPPIPAITRSPADQRAPTWRSSSACNRPFRVSHSALAGEAIQAP